MLTKKFLCFKCGKREGVKVGKGSHGWDKIRCMNCGQEWLDLFLTPGMVFGNKRNEKKRDEKQ